MTTNKVHDPECPAPKSNGFYTCTCEKQQPPTSVTGDEWKEEVAKYYAWMTSANNFSPDIRIKAWQDFFTEHMRLAELRFVEEEIKRIHRKERYDAWLNGFNVDMTNGYNRAITDILTPLIQRREELLNKK